MNELIIDNQTIQDNIYTIRGVQVMLDKDLALLYDVKPTRLREQVRRNTKKFPIDFMFELSENEVDVMVSQNAIPSKQHLGGSVPFVFTEQGVSMLATVLRSDIEEIKQKRKDILENYREKLKSLVQFQEQNESATENYSYFPIVLEDEEQILKVQKFLNDEKIFPRRYFYPSLDTLEYIEPKQECKISRDISKRILCLPIYAELEKRIQEQIIKTIKDVI